MTLHLYEIRSGAADRQEVAAILERLAATCEPHGATVIGSQVTSGHDQVFTVVEVADGAAAPVISAADLGARDVSEPAQVRLVGANLDDLKAAKPQAGYLVEWDIPAEIDMDTYLARKKANGPKYADVPEVDFLRTYVREDTEKCLCFYDAPDEEAVTRARAAVNTPISRLFELG